MKPQPGIDHERVWIHTDWRLGGLGIRGDAVLSGASLVLSRHPEDVGEPLQQTFNIHLSVRDDVPEDEDRREHEKQQKSLSLLGLAPHLLTRAQCELLISRRSTQ